MLNYFKVSALWCKNYISLITVSQQFARDKLSSQIGNKQIRNKLNSQIDTRQNAYLAK